MSFRGCIKYIHTKNASKKRLVADSRVSTSNAVNENSANKVLKKSDSFMCSFRAMLIDYISTFRKSVIKANDIKEWGWSISFEYFSMPR